MQEQLKLFLLIICILPISINAQQPLPRTVYEEDTTAHKKFWEHNNMGELLNSKKFLLGKDIISGYFSYNFGRILINKPEGGYRSIYRNALGWNITIAPYKEYKISTTFFYSLNPEARTRWTPDFQYFFGKFDWRPNVFNYGYENYSNNFYKDNGQELINKFLDGYWFVSYQHALPNNIMSRIRLDKTSNVMLMYFIRYSLRYRDRNEVQRGGILDGKPIFSVGARYTIWKNIYIEGAVNQYVNPAVQKMPWDADFTYGFGYYDWRSFRLSLTYGNYSVNRFPWNKNEMPEYGFLDGNFTLMFNYIW